MSYTFKRKLNREQLERQYALPLQFKKTNLRHVDEVYCVPIQLGSLVTGPAVVGRFAEVTKFIKKKNYLTISSSAVLYKSTKYVNHNLHGLNRA